MISCWASVQWSLNWTGVWYPVPQLELIGVSHCSTIQFSCVWAETWWDDTINQSAFLDFCPGSVPRAKFKSIHSVQFYAIELNLHRMIVDFCPHIRSTSDFTIPFRGCFLKSLNRFTAYSSYLNELKLGRMIPDIYHHNLSELDFSIFSQRRTFCNFQIDSQPTVLIRLSWNLEGWF